MCLGKVICEMASTRCYEMVTEFDVNVHPFTVGRAYIFVILIKMLTTVTTVCWMSCLVSTSGLAKKQEVLLKRITNCEALMEAWSERSASRNSKEAVFENKRF